MQYFFFLSALLISMGIFAISYTPAIAMDEESASSSSHAKPPSPLTVDPSSDEDGAAPLGEVDGSAPTSQLPFNDEQHDRVSAAAIPPSAHSDFRRFVRIKKIKDNAPLARAMANIPHPEVDPSQATPCLPRPIKDVRFTTIPVYSGNSFKVTLRGTAFIVSDSRSVYNSSSFGPANVSYAASGTISPRLYLVSNEHILTKVNDNDIDTSRYAFTFHYLRNFTASAVRYSSDFKSVMVSLEKEYINQYVISHGNNIPGHKIDLACLPLNEIFDFVSEDARLHGYQPFFEAFDLHRHFSTHDGEPASPIIMYGFPGGEFHESLFLPLVTKGFCATDPRFPECAPKKLAETRDQHSAIDFKTNLLAAGGSSGSPVCIEVQNLGKKAVRLLGINIGTKKDQIGYALHASRLRDWLITLSDPSRQPPNFLETDEGRVIREAKLIWLHFTSHDTSEEKEARELQETTVDIIRELQETPCILDFTRSKWLKSTQLSYILERIRDENLLDKIYVVKLPRQILPIPTLDLSIFSPLLDQGNFRFLYLGNVFSLEGIMRTGLEPLQKGKLIVGLTSYDPKWLQDNGLSVAAHQNYYTAFSGMRK